MQYRTSTTGGTVPSGTGIWSSNTSVYTGHHGVLTQDALGSYTNEINSHQTINQMVKAASSSPPLWSTASNTISPLGLGGTPAWRPPATNAAATISVTGVTPKCQQQQQHQHPNSSSRLSFDDSGVNDTTTASSINVNHHSLPQLPTSRGSQESVLSLPVNNSMNSDEELSRSRQCVNSLLAVWTHTSVLSTEFLQGTCDL